MFQVKKIYDSHNYQTGTYAKIINQKGEEIPTLILAKGKSIIQFYDYSPIAYLQMEANIVDIKPLLNQNVESSFYVIVLEDKQVLIGQFRSLEFDGEQKLEFDQTHQLVLPGGSQYQNYIELFVTNTYILFQFSREIYALQSYRFQDGVPFHDPEQFQVIKNTTPGDYIVPIYYKNEYLQTQEAVLVVTRNIGRVFIGLKYLGNGITSRALKYYDDSVQRVYPVQDGLIIKNGKRLEYYPFEDELLDFQILLDSVDATPREIIQLDKFLYITQVNKQVYLLDLNVQKASLIDTYCVADKIIPIGINKIFLASTVDHSLLVNVATGEVEKVFKNLGKIQILSFHQTKLITSFQNDKVRSISEKVKIDSSISVTNYENIPSFSPPSQAFLKTKNFKNSTLTLNRDNVLERSDLQGRVHQTQLNKSISDFEELGDKIYVSFYFSLNILVLNTELQPISTLVKNGESYSQCPCSLDDYSEVSVKGVWSHDQYLFIAQDRGQLTQIKMDGEFKQINHHFDGLFIKKTESAENLMVVYHDKIVVFSKENLKYFILNQQFVHDVDLEGTSHQYKLTSLKKKQRRVDIFHVDDTPYQQGDLSDRSLISISSIHQNNDIIIFVSKKGKFIKIFKNIEGYWNPDQSGQRNLSFGVIDAFQCVVGELIQVYVSGKLENNNKPLLSRFDFTPNGDLLTQFDYDLENPVQEIIRYKDTLLLRDTNYRMLILEGDDVQDYLKQEKCRLNVTEVSDQMILRYDYSCNLSIYYEQNHILYQRFTTLNSLFKVMKDYILRVPLNDELEVYRLKKNRKRTFLEKIGYSKFNEQITALQVVGDILYVGTLRGSVYECQLMNEIQSNVYLEVTKKIEAIAKQNQMEVEKQKKEQEKIEKEKEEEEKNKIQEEQARIITEEVVDKKKPEYYDKFFAKNVENVGNTFFSRDNFGYILKRREYKQLELQLREQFRKLTEYY